MPADPREWLKDRIVRHFFAWDGAALAARLRSAGVKRGDWLMLHASWRQRSGFTGKPRDLIRALADLLGPEGLLIMPSLPYHNRSAAEFLRSGKPIDLRRLPSAMGLLSEVFRRTPGVARSASPTHPLLALGNAAGEFVAGHERAEVPFGAGSPFARLLEHDAWIAGLDVGFSSFTFTHTIEDRIAGTMPFPLYEPQPIAVDFTDTTGQAHHVAVRVISEEANRRRDEEPFIGRLQRSGVLRAHPHRQQPPAAGTIRGHGPVRRRNGPRRRAPVPLRKHGPFSGISRSTRWMKTSFKEHLECMHAWSTASAIRPASRRVVPAKAGTQRRSTQRHWIRAARHRARSGMDTAAPGRAARQLGTLPQQCTAEHHCATGVTACHAGPSPKRLPCPSTS